MTEFFTRYPVVCAFLFMLTIGALLDVLAAIGLPVYVLMPLMAIYVIFSGGLIIASIEQRAKNRKAKENETLS